MIKVTMPFQSPFGTGLMQGMKAGEGLVPEMGDQNAQQMQQIKMALLAQQLANAKTTPMQRNLTALNQMYPSAQTAPPSTVGGPLGGMPPSGAQMTMPSTQGAGMAPIQSLMGQQGAPIGATTPGAFTPMPQSPHLSSLMQPPVPTGAPVGATNALSAPMQPTGAPSMGDQPQARLGGLTLNEARRAVVDKGLGIPYRDPALQAYQASRGRYYDTLTKTAPYRLMSSHLRDALMTQRFSSPEFDDFFKNLSPTDRKKLQPVINQAYQWNNLPASAKMSSIRGSGAENSFNLLQSQYQQLEQAGLQSGISGAAQLTVGQLLNRLGKNSKFANLINQIHQTQGLLAKQFGAMGMFPNTDLGMKAANKIVNIDPTVLGWTGVHKNLNNLKNLLGIETTALHQTTPLSILTGTLPRATIAVPHVEIPTTIKNAPEFKVWFSQLPPAQQQAVKQQYGGS